MINLITTLRYHCSFKANQFTAIKRPTRKQRLLDMYQKVKVHEQAITNKGFLTPDLKQEKYIHSQNYNFEQYYEYTQQVREAQKLNQKQVESQQSPQRPKRSLRIYDRPRYDLDISNYYVWQLFSNVLGKEHDDALQIVCKIQASPKQIRYVFGEGVRPQRNKDSTKEFDFQDSNLSKYLVYDYRETTQYKENKSQDFYENQDHILPRKRIQMRPTSEEFWESNEPYNFRVNCSDYSEYRKFRTWFYKQVEEGQKEPLSYEERLFKKYGKYEKFDDYDKDYVLDAKAAVFSYDRTYFLDKNQKLDQSKPFNDKITAAVKLDDKHKISLEQYLEIKRLEKEEQESELKKYNIIMSIKMDHLNVGLLKNMKITPNVIIDNNVFNKLQTHSQFRKSKIPVMNAKDLVSFKSICMPIQFGDTYEHVKNIVKSNERNVQFFKKFKVDKHLSSQHLWSYKYHSLAMRDTGLAEISDTILKQSQQRRVEEIHQKFRSFIKTKIDPINLDGNRNQNTLFKELLTLNQESAECLQIKKTQSQIQNIGQGSNMTSHQQLLAARKTNHLDYRIRTSHQQQRQLQTENTNDLSLHSINKQKYPEIQRLKTCSTGNGFSPSFRGSFFQSQELPSSKCSDRFPSTKCSDRQTTTKCSDRQDIILKFKQIGQESNQVQQKNKEILVLINELQGTNTKDLSIFRKEQQKKLLTKELLRKKHLEYFKNDVQERIPLNKRKKKVFESVFDQDNDYV